WMPYPKGAALTGQSRPRRIDEVRWGFFVVPLFSPGRKLESSPDHFFCGVERHIPYATCLCRVRPARPARARPRTGVLIRAGPAAPPDTVRRRAAGGTPGRTP